MCLTHELMPKGLISPCKMQYVFMGEWCFFCTHVVLHPTGPAAELKTKRKIMVSNPGHSLP